MPEDPVLVFIQRNEASPCGIERFKVDESNRVERKVLSSELFEVRFWGRGFRHVAWATLLCG